MDKIVLGVGIGAIVATLFFQAASRNFCTGYWNTSTHTCRPF
jgi:hypothetical protein